MDETQTLAVLALRELLDNPDRNDWDELVAAYRALGEAIVENKPMTRKDRARVAEYLREAGWNEGAIGAATTQAVMHVRRGRAAPYELPLDRWPGPPGR
jgi:hypothetical protein